MSPYLHFSIILISVPNLIVISLMVIVFALAVVVATPHSESKEIGDGQ